MRCTISPTFLDSFRYYQSAEDEWKDNARQSILDRLNGVSVASEAMQRGTDFEKMLCQYCDGRDVMQELPTSLESELKSDQDREDLRIIFEYMSSFVKGALRQVYIEFELMQDIHIIGYIDFLNGNTVYDTKTTARYSDDIFPKYARGYQHRAYLAALHKSGIEHFKYLITDFKSIYAEDYYWEPRYIDELRGAVNDWLAYLKIDDEMREAWETKQKIKTTKEVA